MTRPAGRGAQLPAGLVRLAGKDAVRRHRCRAGMRSRSPRRPPRWSGRTHTAHFPSSIDLRSPGPAAALGMCRRVPGAVVRRVSRPVALQSRRGGAKTGSGCRLALSGKGILSLLRCHLSSLVGPTAGRPRDRQRGTTSDKGSAQRRDRRPHAAAPRGLPLLFILLPLSRIHALFLILF